VKFGKDYQISNNSVLVFKFLHKFIAVLILKLLPFLLLLQIHVTKAETISSHKSAKSSMMVFHVEDDKKEPSFS